MQRVSEASVRVDHIVSGAIQGGLLVLLGVAEDDSQDDVIWMAGKIAGLRIFEDGDGRMNLSVAEVNGGILVVSQFTLLGDCRRGKRPSFIEAARPEKARALYESVVAELRGLGMKTETGIFQADMKVSLINDGPVTLLLDSRRTF